MRKLPPVLLPLLLLLAGCGARREQLSPADFTEEARRQPENALSMMTTAEGVEVEQFAAEPLLSNPTNVAVDARGRVWICEANNYRLPYNPRFKERPAGDRILILEDTDGDGKADSSKVFYQGPEVNAALGIAVFGKQVIVSHSPNIYVFYDDDGDDRPDRRDTLFTGINGPDDDHGAHAVIFGPDGRYYFNFGNAGYQLLDKQGKPVPDQQGRAIRTKGDPYWDGMAFRFDPDSSFVEVLGHNFRNNFELTIDSYGSVWQTDNDDDGNQGCRVNFVMEYGNYGYKDELSGAGWSERRPGIEPEIPLRHWHQNDPGVVPNLLQTGAGSPAGMTFYTGDLLPEPFRQQMIHCEALHNVVRAYVTEKKGAGYGAKIVNLLESEDQWFRPSDLAVAPDGSVLVADWYDPGVGGNKMDDIQRGRIYRLAPKVSIYKVPAIDLKTPEGAVKALLNPNADVHYQAWNRLREWGPEAEKALQGLWSDKNPRNRARALWLLARLPGKTATYLEQALKDGNVDIRITALRAARQLDPARLITYLRQASGDSDPALRREAAIALRYQNSAEAHDLWAELATRYDGQDRWYLEALGIGADIYPDARFAAWQKKVAGKWNTQVGRQMVWRLRTAQTTPLLVELIRDPQVDTAWLGRYFRAFHFKPQTGRDEALAGLLQLDHPQMEQIRRYGLGMISAGYVQKNPAFRKRLSEWLPSIQGSPEWLSAIRSMQLRDQTANLFDFFLNGKDPGLQQEAVGLLFEFGGGRLVAGHFAKLEGEARQAFIGRLGGIQHPEAVNILAAELKRSGLGYPMQVQLVEALGNTWDGQHLLFDELRNNRLPAELVNTAALKLMNCWDPEIRGAAPSYLSSAKGKGGELPPVHELAARTGNAAKGKEVFSQHCYTCHQLGGLGTAFGPDLSAVGAKLAREALFTSILYPSAGINYGYEGYLVRLKDGNMLSGILSSQTSDQVALKLISGAQQTIDRAQLASLEPMKESLMTANLQALMSEQELVDLVEFLTTLQGEVQ